MKKGFTLVEFLIVLVMSLALIIPITLYIRNNKKEKEVKENIINTTNDIINDVEAYYKEMLDNKKYITKVSLNNSNFSYEIDGSFKYDKDGKASGKIYMDGYCVVMDNDITMEKMDKVNCNTNILMISGVEYYYNPEKDSKCTKEEADANTSLNKGCMKWYSILDDGSENISLLLSHNIGENVMWNSTGSNKSGPVTVNKELAKNITTWNKNIKTTARLITAEEIANITNNKGWFNDNKWYYLHNNSDIEYVGASESNRYAWLFDNTKNCTSYGCNISSDKTYGYWTSSTNSTSYAWNIFHDGTFDIAAVNATNRGVRPVIKVNRYLFYK